MIRHRLIKIVVPTVGATLAAAGIAVAANGGSSGSGTAQANPQSPPPIMGAAGKAPGSGAGSRQLPPPPPGGPGAPGGPGHNGELAYGELHVVKGGDERTVRLDRGEIDKVSSSEITITEANDDEVTIPVDDSTKVLAGPGQTADVSDLEQGDQVMVARPSADDAADSVAVCPDPGQRPPRLPAPPSQGRSGGAQQAPQQAPSGATS